MHTRCRPLSREEVRDVDRRAIADYGLPGIVLMENAGRGAAELLCRLGIQGTVVICAGKGNNGGDGFVIARHLENWGHDVRVFLFCDPEELQGDAATNHRVLVAAHTSIDVMGREMEPNAFPSVLANADWVVDALLGTGAQGEPREPYRTAIDAVNRSSRQVLAVDLPSGMDCDSGKGSESCIRAAHTATFVAPKIGFGAPGAAALTGTVHVIDIGVPKSLLDSGGHLECR